MKKVLVLFICTIFLKNYISLADTQTFQCKKADGGTSLYKVKCDSRDGINYVNDADFDNAFRECSKTFDGTLHGGQETKCTLGGDFTKHSGESCNNRYQIFHCGSGQNLRSYKVKCKEQDGECWVDLDDYEAKNNDCLNTLGATLSRSANARCKLASDK